MKNEKTRKWKPIVFREGIYAVADADRFAARCDDPKFVAKCLAQHQKWRKSEGEYVFHEDPKENAAPPLCPKALTIVEDAAIRFLMEAAKCRARA